MQSKKQDYLNFFKTVGKSKRLPRTGWVREKVKNPESIAEHSFRVGVLAMVLADKLGANKEKLMKMALLVDLGELATGDMVTARGEYIDIKKQDEMEKMGGEEIKKIFGKVGNNKQYLSVYREMVNRDTSDAKVFWQLERLEMALQALEYEEEQGKNLEEFFVNTELYLKEPLLKKIFYEILKYRKINKKRSFGKLKDGLGLMN